MADLGVVVFNMEKYKCSKCNKELTTFKELTECKKIEIPLSTFSSIGNIFFSSSKKTFNKCFVILCPDCFYETFSTMIKYGERTITEEVE